MRWRIPLFVTLVSLVAVSCDQQPLEPTHDVVAAEPAFDFSNGPAMPGNSAIVRDAYGDFVWVFWDDPAGPYVVVTDQDFDCDGQWVYFDEDTLVPFQQIFNPSSEGLVMAFEGGWLNAAIYGTEECSSLLATGMVHNQWMDNDVEAFAWERQRSNAYGGHLNGQIGDYTFNWKIRCVWSGGDKDQPAGFCKESIHIQ